MTVSTGLQRAEGASAEHYALCRCGQSRNKPFCSGMHWYAGFRDPVPHAAREPTPFEWAGGLPGLTRGMTRLLYAKHVPADPLLAEVFAGDARRPAAAAGRLAGGGTRRPALETRPAAASGPDGDARDVSRAVGARSDGFGEQHRARWVSLLGAAADDAALPADPAFRSVLSSCAGWLSRTALAQAQQGAAAPAPAPGTAGPAMPRWGWLLVTTAGGRDWLSRLQTPGMPGRADAVLAGLTARVQAGPGPDQVAPACVRLRGSRGEWLTVQGDRLTGTDGRTHGISVIVGPARLATVLPLLAADTGSRRVSARSSAACWAG